VAGHDLRPDDRWRVRLTGYGPERLSEAAATTHSLRQSVHGLPPREGAAARRSAGSPRDGGRPPARGRPGGAPEAGELDLRQTAQHVGDPTRLQIRQIAQGPRIATEAKRDQAPWAPGSGRPVRHGSVGGSARVYDPLCTWGAAGRSGGR
jgi:hypothetical protein